MTAIGADPVAATAAIEATAANDAGTLAPTRMPARQNPCALSYTKEIPCTP